MFKKFIVPIGILWICAGLLLSACQPQSQTSGGPTPVKPADTAQPQTQVTSEPTLVKPTDTAQPVMPTKTRIPFIFPTDTPRPPVPTEDSGLSVQWTFQTERAIWGTPAVDHGVAYIGSDDGNLYAIDVKTGQMQWKFVTGGIVRSCPSISNGFVYIASDDGFVYAIDAKDGKQIWKTDIGNAYPREKRENLGNSPNPFGFDYRQSSPVLADGLIYVGSFDGNVYALGEKDGQVAWKFKTGDKVRATATIDHGVVYVGSWDGKSYALDAKTGEPRWVTPVQGQVQTTALVVDGMVITASRKASVQALDIDTGELVWEYSYGPNSWVESSPQLAGKNIIIGSSGSLRVVAIDYKTGDLSWLFSSESFNWSTPLPIEDTVYIGGAFFNDPSKGGMFVLKVTDKNLPFNNVKHRIFSMTETKEYSGQILGVAGSPVMVDGILYFGSLDGKLYAVKD